MTQAPIELRLTLHETSMELTCVLKNSGSMSLRVGGLNLANISIRPAEDDGNYPTPWLSEHIRNNRGVYELAPNAELEFEGDLLSNFRFENAGVYVVRAVYDSMGFCERFGHAPSRKEDSCFAEWARIDPARALSNEVVFVLSEADLQANRQAITHRTDVFFGKRRDELAT